MKNQRALINQVLAERPEPTVALNPLTGLHLDDLKDIFSRTALQGARQPLILGKHLSNHARKLADILARSLSQKKAPRQPGNKAYLAGVAAPGAYASQQSE